MASRRSHAASHSRNYFICLHPPIANAQSAPCPEGTRIHLKPTASSEGAQLWDNPPHPNLVPRSGTDYHPQHHTGCVSPPSGNYMGWKYRTYPQRRCFAACSGFHDIGPASRNPQLMLNLLSSVGAWLCHANIAQRVKTCYKIKIDSRDLDGCFYGVLLYKQHPCLTIEPLLHSNSATIRQ